MRRPTPHLPWTRNGDAPTDSALKRMGGIIVGEAGSERESKKENHEEEIDWARADLEKAKGYMRAVKKITALRQKEWESSREYDAPAPPAGYPDTPAFLTKYTDIEWTVSQWDGYSFLGYRIMCVKTIGWTTLLVRV